MNYVKLALNIVVICLFSTFFSFNVCTYGKGLSEEEKKELDRFAAQSTPQEVYKHFQKKIGEAIQAELFKIFKPNKDVIGDFDLNIKKNKQPQIFKRQSITLSAEELIDLGTKYLALENFSKAKEIYLMALNKATNSSSRTSRTLIDVQTRLGELYFFLNQQGLSIKMYLSAIKNSENYYGFNHINTIKLYQDFASTLKKKYTKDALGYYDKALKGLRENDNFFKEKASILLDLYGIYTQLRKSRLRENIENKILKIAPRFQDPTDIVSADIAIQIEYIVSHGKNTERVFYLTEKLLNFAIHGFGNESLFAQNIRLRLVSILYHANKIKQTVRIIRDAEKFDQLQASNIVFNTMKDKDLRELLKHKRNFLNLVINLSIDYPNFFNELCAKAIFRNKFLTEERSTLLSFNMASEIHDDDLLAMLANNRFIRNRISHYAANSLRGFDILEIDVRNAALNFYEQHQQRIIEKLITQNKYFNKFNTAAKNVIPQLPRNAALIEYQIYRPIKKYANRSNNDYRLAALVITDRIKIVDIGNITEINAQVNRLRDSYTHEKSNQLFSKLIKPIEKEIENFYTIYIVPDGNLNLLPFGQLRTDDQKYWIEKKLIKYLRTGRHLNQKNPPFQTTGMVIMGNIDYNRFPQLKGQDQEPVINSTQLKTTQKFSVLPIDNNINELSDIQKSYYNKYGEEATFLVGEYNLKRLKTAPKILHILSHGFSLKRRHLEDSHPMLLSGIALSGANIGINDGWGISGEDGLLFSEEAQDLCLTGTELVTLSACNTGKGIIDLSEGVYSCSRAFLIAGANAVLVSLSQIHNYETALFMSAFYRKWLAGANPNISPAEALRDTQLLFIHNTNFSLRSPEIWSPFIIVEKGSNVF